MTPEQARRERELLTPRARQRQRWERAFFFWYVPTNAIEGWMRRRYDRALPPREAPFYDDYTREDLVDRILFLESAGRGAWIMAEFWRTVALPAGMFLAALAGLLLGSCR